MNKVQRKLVVDALEYEHLLSEWESEFINNLAERDEENPYYHLTPKQNETLNKISNKLAES